MDKVGSGYEKERKPVTDQTVYIGDGGCPNIELLSTSITIDYSSFKANVGYTRITTKWGNDHESITLNGKNHFSSVSRRIICLFFHFITFIYTRNRIGNQGTGFER